MHDPSFLNEDFASHLVAAGRFGKDVLAPHGRYHAVFREYDQGPIFHEERFDNLLTTQGKAFILDTALGPTTSYTAAEFMGLISSASFGAANTTISSGTYNTGTGAVSLTTAAAHGLGPGDVFVVASATGTGSFASINGIWVATAGTTGTTLNYTIATSLTMTITGGTITTGIKGSDTQTSHSGWVEAGSANAPTYSGSRPSAVFSASTLGGAPTYTVTKALSAGLTFTFTGSGTVNGGFIVGGSGASATVGNTGGSLVSAGVLTTAQPVISGNTLTMSYQMTMS